MRALSAASSIGPCGTNAARFAGKSESFLSCIYDLLSCGGDGRWYRDNNSDPSVSRVVVDVIKERLAEWQLTQYAHKERARVDAQVAMSDKTGSFKRTGWLDYFANRNLMHPAHKTRLPDRGEVSGEANGAAGGGAG
jgi:hypothetical protein